MTIDFRKELEYFCAMTLQVLLSHAMRPYSVRSDRVLLAIWRYFSKIVVIKVLKILIFL